MELIRPITLNDLPEGSRMLAELLGLERFLVLAENYGGEMIYVPTLKHIRTEMRNNNIRAEYLTDSPEIEKLSRKYRLSERQIRNIIRK